MLKRDFQLLIPTHTITRVVLLETPAGVLVHVDGGPKHLPSVIEAQRGGARHFKTMTAAVNFVRASGWNQEIIIDVHPSSWQS